MSRVSATPDVDLLVVGSGPVGSTYARRVSELCPHARILMVEAGPSLTDPPGMHVRNIADPDVRLAAQHRSEGPMRDERARAVKARAEAAVAAHDRLLVRPGIFFADPENAAALTPGTLTIGAMASNVGGMGSHWSFACPHPGGTERIPWIDDATWEAALAEGRTLLAVGPDTFPATVQSEAILLGLGEAFDGGLPTDRRVQRMPLACAVGPEGSRYWTGTDVVLGATLRSPRFDLRAETLCRRLVHDDAWVTGAELQDLRTGRSYAVAARAVVVAGDALRTPQLLWASGIRPDALGRHLNDHNEIIVAVRIAPDLLARAARERPGLPNARRDSDDAIIGVFWVPFSEAHPFHGQVMHLDLAPLEIAPEVAAKDQVVGLGWFVPKDIRAEDRVVFSDEVHDGYGMPAISTEYGLSQRDRSEIDAARVDILRAAASLGELLPDSPEPKLLPPGASLHYQGTVRMGRDETSSVCDASSRVWGFENLFVGGNGVIPTATAGNPTLTSVTLAVHASRAVAELCGV